MTGSSYSLGWGNVPDGDVFLLGLIVNGDVGGLVNFRRLQNQHLRHRERVNVADQDARSRRALRLVGAPVDERAYREAQAVGGSLGGLHDNVHPEVELLPQGRMLHRLLLKPLDQVQILHNGSQVPEGESRPKAEGFSLSARLRQQMHLFSQRVCRR